MSSANFLGEGGGGGGPQPQELVTLPVAHVADTSGLAQLNGQFNPDTGLGAFVLDGEADFFVPTSNSGLWIAGNKILRQETLTIIRKSSEDIALSGAIPVYVKNTNVSIEGGSSRLAARLEADFTGDIPAGKSFRVELSNVAGFNNTDKIQIFHNPNAAEEGMPLEYHDGDLSAESMGSRLYLYTIQGRCLEIDDSGEGSNYVYVDPSGAVGETLLYQAESGDDGEVQTLSTFDVSEPYGGIAFPVYLDPATGNIYHNIAFVSSLTLVIQYPPLNILIEMPYIADTTGLVNVYGTGNMGAQDALVATFADEQDHYIACSQTQRPNEVTVAA